MHCSITVGAMGLSAAEVFDGLGKDYEQAFAGLAAQREEVEWLLTELPDAANVLDVGCGTGRPTAEMLVAAGHDVTGCDVSPRMIEIARAQVPGARFEVADLRTLTYPPGTWDAVVAFFPLLQLTRAEIVAALEKFARWLKPDGIFLFATVPADIEGLDIEFMGKAVTVSSYPAEEFPRLLGGAGLAVVRERVVEFLPDHPSAIPEHDLFLAARRSRG
ncbi:class I SAM-dependent methyltransferase [Nocardia seriolae]|nr:class I SAM-dependent methyltransferase [Nocardia seriolae]GEM23645.1 methyltransferase [Nocardia seriolae NBRC 15557]